MYITTLPSLPLLPFLICSSLGFFISTSSHMAGMKPLPENSDVTQVRTAAADLISDDDRSVASDSWSIKSEYGSTLDDEQRHANATEALNYRVDYSFGKDEQDSEKVSLMLGFQS